MTVSYDELVALTEELHRKAWGADWNGTGFVRELRILAQKIEAICAARMLDLEFSNAGMDRERRSGTHLEAQRTGEKSGLGQRTASSGSVSGRAVSSRHRSRKKVGIVGRKQ